MNRSGVSFALNANGAAAVNSGPFLAAQLAND